MALPSSGQISFSQLASELGNSCTDISLRSYSACANLSSPDNLTELWGKSCTSGPASWSNGPNMINVLFRMGSSTNGSRNSALSFGGECATPGITVSCTEEFNGSSWASGGSLSISRNWGAPAGTQNAALYTAGRTPSTTSCWTEEYNGTSWSTGGNLTYGRRGLGGTGTQNAGLAYSGANPGNFPYTDEYNGTNWTRVNNMIRCGYGLNGIGTQNSALTSNFGAGSTLYSCTQEYNGSTWATAGNTVSTYINRSLGGVQNDTMMADKCGVEFYNGSTWSSSPTSVPDHYLGYSGTSSSDWVRFGSLDCTGAGRTYEYYSTIVCLA